MPVISVATAKPLRRSLLGGAYSRSGGAGGRSTGRATGRPSTEASLDSCASRVAAAGGLEESSGEGECALW